MTGTLTNLIAGVEVREAGTPWKPPPVQQTRWFNIGPINSGKTAIATSICGDGCRCVVLDYEDKTDMVADPKAEIIVIRDHARNQKVIDWLVKDRAKTFQMVGIDTIDALCYDIMRIEMTQQIKKKNPQWAAANPYADITEWKASDKGSAGWAMLNNRTYEVLAQLVSAGYGLWINGHTKEKDGVPGVSISAGLHGPIYRMVHFKTMSVLNEQPMTKEINGKTITLPSKQLAQSLYVQTKVAGTATPVIGNLALPSPIDSLPKGEQWQRISEVYRKTVETQQSENKE